MKILLTGTSLLASYGGPAYSTARLAQALANAGGEVGIWASDRSARSTPYLLDRAPVKRLEGDPAEALAAFGKPDVLHDNGLWLPHHHRLAVLAARYGICRIVSPRGMLEPWAMRHKSLKKCVAWRLYQRRDLRQTRMLHATADREAANLDRLDLGIPTCTIPNGVDLPDLPLARSLQAEHRTMLFLGRIYPVKGLPLLIEAWARVRPHGWQLRIAGPDEAGHRAEIERAVIHAGIGDVVSFLGPLDVIARRGAYLEADALVLPSHSESFGMVVAEALAHGIPVLTTTGAPWLSLASRGCGWSVEPAVEAIASGLRVATALDRHALRAMGARGRSWMAADFGWDTIAQRFMACYEQLASQATAA